MGEKEKTDVAAQLQQTIKKAAEDAFVGQIDFFRKMTTSQLDAAQDFLTVMQRFTQLNAMFKTVVQSGGRISIPEAERRTLGIEDGELVQVVVFPLKKKSK